MLEFPLLTLLANAGGVPRGAMGAILSAALGAAAGGLLTAAGKSVRQTMLVSAWIWSQAAMVAVCLAEVAFQLQSHDQTAPWLSAVRYLASVMTFCPVVSVLGSKRPQHVTWNFVVLSLWGIVALPAVQSLALGRTEQFELSGAWGWLLWILTVLTAVNYLPTRFGWAGTLVVTAQVVLLSPHLPLIRQPLLTTDPGLVALLCLTGAALVAWRTSLAPGKYRFPYDRLWRDFRDMFGLFWGLQVQERVNAAARMYAWPFYLSWTGFRRCEDQRPLDVIPAAHERAVRQTLRGLLRRFVSAAWIAARLPKGVD